MYLVRFYIAKLQSALSNVRLEQGQSLPNELCSGNGNVTNDDADLDIGFIGTR